MNDAKLIFGVVGGSLLLLMVVALGVSRMTVDQGDGEVKQISRERRLVMGAEDAKVEVVEFSDFQCPACKAAQGLVKQVQNKEGVRLVFKHMPLSSIHKNALIAAEAAEAAHDQGKFWEYHDLLFERQEEWAEEKEIELKLTDYAVELGLDRETFMKSLSEGKFKDLVMSDYGEAMRLGVRGTPTFFVNGKRTSAGDLVREVEAALGE